MECLFHFAVCIRTQRARGTLPSQLLQRPLPNLLSLYLYLNVKGLGGADVEFDFNFALRIKTQRQKNAFQFSSSQIPLFLSQSSITHQNTAHTQRNNFLAIYLSNITHSPANEAVAMVSSWLHLPWITDVWDLRA